MQNSVRCRSYNCCSYRIRRTLSKIFIFTATQMKWKKKVFSKPLIFFFPRRKMWRWMSKKTPRQKKYFATCSRCHDIWPINLVTPHNSSASRVVFLIPKMSHIIRHCKFVLQGGSFFLKKHKRHVLFKLEQRTRRRKNLSLNRVFSQVGQ